MVDNEVLACLPEAIAAAERPGHKALTQQLFRHRLNQALELADGYAFRFPAAAGAENAVWLKMTGPEGTREVLEA
jgi:hypothetical protein